MAQTVWVADDDQSIRWVLEKALTREQFDVRIFSNGAELLSALSHAQPDLVLSDIRMPGLDGIAMLKNIKTRHPELPVIIMTAFSDLDSAVTAFQGGAFEYLAKPFDLPEAVALIRRASAQGAKPAPEQSSERTPEMLGVAPSMQELFRAIGRLSQSAVTVLVTGESGSGKELVAAALHKHSSRSSSPFIALNTAAIPKDLLESELFGHEKGAFTGAQQTRRGRFEQAEGGTLFLDEIGDMPAELQTRLLRVLSDGNFYRVGGQYPVKANVRVIAATHQDLEERVRQGLFREDLFHRLNVIRLRVPPLRERIDDVGLLAKHFLLSCARELSVDAKHLSDAALGRLKDYAWPGNVRQLENVCRWLTVMAPAKLVEVGDLPPELRSPASSLPIPTPVIAQVTVPKTEFSNPVSEDTIPASGTTTQVDAMYPEQLTPAVDANNWQALLEKEIAQVISRQMMAGPPPEQSDVMEQLYRRFESVIITTTLKHTRGRRIEAAERLGIGRNTITRKIAELGIKE